MGDIVVKDIHGCTYTDYSIDIVLEVSTGFRELSLDVENARKLVKTLTEWLNKEGDFSE